MIYWAQHQPHRRGKKIDGNKDDFCWDCNTRLYHIESGEMINTNNRKCYIPDGAIFEEISCCCQDIVQKRIQCEFGFEFITICNDVTRGNHVQALVSREYIENRKEKHVQASVSREYIENR